jgi:hypothetical protein
MCVNVCSWLPIIPTRIPWGTLMVFTYFIKNLLIGMKAQWCCARLDRFNGENKISI